LNEVPVQTVSGTAGQKAQAGRRHLLRGLSTLFWSLPLSLLVSIQTLVTDNLRGMGVVPPVLCTGALLFGTQCLNYFNPEGEFWRLRANQLRLVAVILVGLSPFVYFWNRYPGEDYFRSSIFMIGLAAFAFLLFLNRLLRELAPIIPRPELNAETQLFTNINTNLIYFSIAISLVFAVLPYLSFLPGIFLVRIEMLESIKRTLLLFLFLFPLSLTMTLLWKYKECVVEEAFREE